MTAVLCSNGVVLVGLLTVNAVLLCATATIQIKTTKALRTMDSTVALVRALEARNHGDFLLLVHYANTHGLPPPPYVGAARDDSSTTGE